MPGPLVATKLIIPSPAKNLVVRPHLLAKLDQSRQPGVRLTLVSAPAGFGKTTLVGAWAGGLKAANAPLVAWLSLDEGDNDPVVFWSYLVAALQTQLAGIGEQALTLLHAPQSPDPRGVAVMLVNDLTQIPDSMVLVLDDFHSIRNPDIHQSLAFLIERVPPQAHMVIATRTDPPLPLALLRSRGQLSEIRLSDLRFSDEEAYAFLCQRGALTLSPSAAAQLNSKTEGWAAGLQMAMASLHGSVDIDRFIASFSGNSRHILDFLIEEVLNRQTPDVQDFLLTTSILDSLCGPLCDDLLAAPGDQTGPARATPAQAEQMLKWLEDSNLFLFPLDNERYWYRYHRLFADLLRKRLGQTAPDRVAALHRRASHWYEENGLAEPAIQHAFLALDHERAARLVEAVADRLWAQGEHARLLSWLQKLPDETIRAHLTLNIFKAGVLALKGSLREAEHCLQQAEERLPVAALDEPLRDRWAGRAATVRALIAESRGDEAAIRRYGHLATDKLSPGQDAVWRIIALVALGQMNLTQGDFATCRQHLLQAVEAGKSAGCFLLLLEAMTKLVLALWLAGRLREAAEVCREGLQLIDQNRLDRVPTTSMLYLSWGFMLYEHHRLDEAKHFIVRGLDLSRAGDNPIALAWAYHELAMVLMAQGDLAAAEAANREADRQRQDHELPYWLVCTIAGHRALIWIKLGRLAEAERYLEARNIRFDGTMEHPHQVEYEALVNLLLAKGEPSAAAELLERLISAARADHQESWVIAYQTLQCLVHQSLGNRQRALEVLESALSLAEPEGTLQIFVEKGDAMARLLHEAARQGICPGYASRLLAAFSAVDLQSSGVPTAQSQAQPLIEPLSDREIEIIRLISGGLSNKEIAQRLHISLRTVKYHTTNIYSKLGVNSRTQALVRGRALGIILEA